MTATKKTTRRTRDRAATEALLVQPPKPGKEVRYTESQLFGTTPSAVFLDEVAQVPTGGKPSEKRTSRVVRSVADWLAEEAMQGRFYATAEAATGAYLAMAAKDTGVRR